MKENDNAPGRGTVRTNVGVKIHMEGERLTPNGFARDFPFKQLCRAVPIVRVQVDPRSMRKSEYRG